MCIFNILTSIWKDEIYYELYLKHIFFICILLKSRMAFDIYNWYYIINEFNRYIEKGKIVYTFSNKHFQIEY